MADLFQGAALPDVTTTTQSQDTAPQFYTDYLQDIANLGQSAVQQGGVAGFSPLQQQALQQLLHCLHWLLNQQLLLNRQMLHNPHLLLNQQLLLNRHWLLNLLNQ
jgi:hypothetical protein